MRKDPPAWFCWLALSAWCAALFFYGMASAELWRTENLRAIIAEAMLRTGNWLVPTLYGEPLFTKPPGMYMAIALCSLPWGEVTEFSARLPSALAASATVFLFYHLFARFLGRGAGLLAGLILPMSVMYLDKAPAAEIDMLQVGWVTAALVCFLRAVERIPSPPASLPEGERCRFAWWLGALLCVAGGFLTKWTAPAFFYITAVAMLWWRGELRLLWSRQHLSSLFMAGCLCLAWIVAAACLTGWEVFVNTVLAEALPRLWVPASSPQHQRLSYGWGVVAYPWWILAAMLPWSIVALFSLRPSYFRAWDERPRQLAMLLHCWAWPNLLFWTLMADHTPRYCFPLCPAIAGLAALVMHGWWTGRVPLPWPRIPPRRLLLGCLAFWLVVKVAFVEHVMPTRNGQREPRARGRLLASLVPAGATLYLFRIKDEGIMFYFGGQVVRLASPARLPSSGEPIYCILNPAECDQLRTERRLRVVRELYDEQGAPMVLVQVADQ